MAINRAWLNALVDDDGSGNTGTVWNKAAITGLLDAVDGMFEANKTWTPRILFGGASTGWAISALARYARADNLILVEAQFNVVTVGSATGQASLVDLPYPPSAVDTIPLATIDPAFGLAGLTGAPIGVYAGGIVYLMMQPPALATSRAGLGHSNFPAGAQFNFSMVYRKA